MCPMLSTMGVHRKLDACYCVTLIALSMNGCEVAADELQ